MYQEKWRIPKHPREAECQKAGERKSCCGSNPAGLVAPMIVASSIAAPMMARVFEILAGRKAN